MNISHILLPLLLIGTPALWALGPDNMTGKTLRLGMNGMQISRSPIYHAPVPPWYTLDEVCDFVVAFPNSDEFTAEVDYSVRLSNEVTVSYHPNTKENEACVKIESAELSILLTLTYTSNTGGTATVAWHEAGNTRHLRNISFTVENGADEGSRVQFPEEIIPYGPEIWNDGLCDILRNIERGVYSSEADRLYQRRLTTLLPVIMVLHDASYTNPDYKGNTALHYACALGHVELVRWLVNHGANLELRTEKGAGIDACVGSRNGDTIRAILKQARRERDYPLRGPQVENQEADKAVAWLEAAFTCADVNSELYEIPFPDAKAEEYADLLYVYVRQNREFPRQVDVTEPLGNLLVWLRDANIHRGMFCEAVQKQLYTLRAAALLQHQKAGKTLALLPHMILTRENEGMPYDGATAVYRAACEGNAELVRWLIDNGADCRLRDEHGHTAELPQGIPNEAAIRAMLPSATAPENVVGKTFTFTGKQSDEPIVISWQQQNSETEGEVRQDEDWCIEEKNYNRTGNRTATITRATQWAPGGSYAAGWRTQKFNLSFTSATEGTATCTEESKTGENLTFTGNFTLR